MLKWEALARLPGVAPGGGLLASSYVHGYNVLSPAPLGAARPALAGRDDQINR